ncbi:MAG: DUF4911 domain-containing protein [Deltaproteobacteria bacterium]|nr:DUF4911 domain-containing protein [Deltaproteobacteria bacterium]
MINYISTILGSYSGICFAQTIDPNEAVIEFGISPCCLELVEEIITSLIRDEGIRLEKMVVL